MTNVYDVPVEKLIPAVAKDLQENVGLKQPEWAMTVKTGAQAQRAPEDENWWWIRAASILRKIYVNGPIGVSRLRTSYGGRKNRGVKPSKFQRAGGKIIRVILQDLDNAGFTKKALLRKGLAERTQVYAGREITSKGQSYLDKIAATVNNG